MNLSERLSKHYKIILIAAGLLFVAGAPVMPMESLVVAVGLSFGMIIYFNPKLAVAIMLVMLPFANMPFFQAQVIGFLPLKLSVIVFSALFAVMMIKYKMNLNSGFEIINFTLMILYFLIFIAAIVNAMDYLEYISLAWHDDFSVVRMISNFTVTPIVMMLPAVIVLLYYNYEDYPHVLSALVLAMFTLSVTILFLYVFVIPAKLNFMLIRRQISDVIRLHGNDIANFYIMTFPVLLVLYMNRRNKLIRATFYLSLFAVAILFSRTAYVCVIFTFVAFGFRRGRIDGRFFGVLLTVAIGMLFMPQQVIDRLAAIVVNADINTYTSGRTDFIWKPLLLDWINSTSIEQLFGVGRYSIVQTFVYRTGIIIDVTHPHNMYLESLMDIGILGFIAYMSIYMYMGVQIFFGFLRERDDFDKDMLFAVLMSFFLYLLSGMSGRTLFPSPLNTYEWVLLAVGIIILRHQKYPVSFWKRGNVNG